MCRKSCQVCIHIDDDHHQHGFPALGLFTITRLKQSNARAGPTKSTMDKRLVRALLYESELVEPANDLGIRCQRTVKY